MNMKTKTLTEGTPWKLLLSFSIPILIGRIVQLFYSLVDTKIVGSTMGELALASVGSVSSLYSLLTGFLNGLTLGFSILTAMHFGAGDERKLKKSFGASIVLGTITTVLLIVVILVFLKPILQFMNVPEEEFEMAYAYISILVIGMIVTLFYNLLANTMRAIGDSVTPLIYLAVACVSNIALDYLCILGFHMGVAGAAVATVAAQVLSVVLCAIRVKRRFAILHLEREDFRMNRELVAESYKSGLSMGFMTCLVGFGTVVLQSAINSLGTSVIVAHTAARKVQEILMMPQMVLGSAMATYSGQNYGARLYGRIRRGLRSALTLAAIWSAAACLISWTVSSRLVGFIASSVNPEVLYWASTYLKTDNCFLFICSVIVILRNSMQGFGDRRTPVFSSCIELAGKTLFAMVFAPMLGYWGVIWAEPAVWAVMVIPLIVKTVKFFRTMDGEPTGF